MKRVLGSLLRRDDLELPFGNTVLVLVSSAAFSYLSMRLLVSLSFLLRLHLFDWADWIANIVILTIFGLGGYFIKSRYLLTSLLLLVVSIGYLFYLSHYVFPPASIRLIASNYVSYSLLPISFYVWIRLLKNPAKGYFETSNEEKVARF